MPSLGESMSDDQSKPGQRRTKMTDEERREKQGAYQKFYYKDNKADRRAAGSRYYELNKDKLKAKRDAIKHIRAMKERERVRNMTPEQKKHRKHLQDLWVKKNRVPKNKKTGKVKADRVKNYQRRKKAEKLGISLDELEVREAERKARIIQGKIDKEKAREEREARDTPERRISKTIINAVRSRAKKKGMPFDLDLDWLALIIKKGRCEATDDVFNHEFKVKQTRPYAPSVHRIDPLLGYTKDNCKVVTWAWNRMVGDGTDGITKRVIKAMIDKDRREQKERRIRKKEQSNQIKLFDQRRRA